MDTKLSRLPATIRRLHPLRLLEHHVNALSFITLVITGLAQRFHDNRLSEFVILGLGGIDQTRWVHRFAGAAFALVMLQHVVVGLFGMTAGRWRPSMIINRKDFQDALHNLRFYFGRTPHPARCDRFDYKQKFEYWGVLLGGVVMTVTGLMLWFPTAVFQVAPFLPGQVLPAAKVMHGNEAMMAFLIIVTWHIYNAIFSPEVFPLDTTILTGRISAKRLQHEHPLEYERLVAALPAEPPAAEPPSNGTAPDASAMSSCAEAPAPGPAPAR